MEMVLAYLTAKDKEEAQNLARGLLKNRLVGCVNILTGMNSLYWWKGQLEESQEVVLIGKTRADQADNITEWVRAHHSYECPCVLFLPITAGNLDYLSWLNSELDSK